LGVTIHYALGIRSAQVKPALDRTQALAEDIKREQAAPLSVPLSIRRPNSTKLLIDLGECETLVFDFNAYEKYQRDTDAGDGRRVWSYEQSVLGRTFAPQVLTEDEESLKRWPEQRLMWASAFCKTQFAAALAEHRWVAELIRSVAAVADYAHVYDEGAYYHTLNIEEAAEAIHANGLLINSIGARLGNMSGNGVRVILVSLR
jgi:hypothetical protein